MLLIIAGWQSPFRATSSRCSRRRRRVPPEDEGWAFEIKWDGVRALAYCEDGALRISSRRGEDASHRYPELTGLPDALGGRAAILDGEVVAFDAEGRPSFQTLQKRMGLSRPETIRRRSQEVPVTFVAFDLLHLDSESLLSEPYERRRELLAELELDGDCWRAPGAPDRRRARVPRSRPRPGARGDRLQAARHAVPARAGGAPTGSRSARASARSW